MNVVGKIYTIAALFMIMIYSLAGAFIVMEIVRNIAGIPMRSGDLTDQATFVVVMAVMAVFVYLYIRTRLRLRRRPDEMHALILAQGYDIDAPAGEFKVTENLKRLGTRGNTVKNILTGKDWQYADYSYDIYWKAKNSEYKAATVYYSVLQLKLPRALPNILFDSPETHHKQFQTYFHKSQIHKLEGNFDKYFTTYFPAFYSIDSLSIISPEVMQAMIDASEYDIEIDGDNLYLYRPLIMSQDIPAMVEKGQKIREKLMNNIVTYRDERIAFADGRKAVSVFGQDLMLNPFRGWPALVYALGIMAAGVWMGADTGEWINEAVIFGAIMVCFIVYSMLKVWNKNRRMIERYHEQHTVSEETESVKSTQ